jgi:hypothetical protein
VAAADARMLRTALLLRRFTLRELVMHAAVPRDTAHSWVKRNLKRDHIGEWGDDASKRRGRPAKIWIVSDQGAVALRQRLDSFNSAPDQPPPATDGHFRRLRELSLEWAAATQSRDQSYQTEVAAAARVRMRAAWQSYAEMHELGYAVPSEALEELAQFERTLCIGEWWIETDLRAIASWLAGRFRIMGANGVELNFAARVLCARAQARGRETLAQLTTAALGLQIWFDEFPDQLLTAEDVKACLSIREVVPIRLQLDHAFSLLTPARSRILQVQPEQRQAIVLGLATAYPVDEEVTTWLLSLEDRDCWSDELAPAVAYGTADRPHVHLRSLVKSFRSSLQRAVESETLPSGMYAGRIRRQAQQFARKVLLPYATTSGSSHSTRHPSATNLAQVAAYFSSSGIGSP